jgi:hypothetical protein
MFDFGSARIPGVQGGMSLGQAIAVLVKLSGMPAALGNWQPAFRKAAWKCHPDMGGQLADFVLLMEAKRVLVAWGKPTFRDSRNQT